MLKRISVGCRGAWRYLHASGRRPAEVCDPPPAEGAGLKRGDRVLVRYGRFAGRVGEVDDVFRQGGAGRKNAVVWVRFADRTVEGFDPKNLLKKER
jgi:hypothetical protein